MPTNITHTRLGSKRPRPNSDLIRARLQAGLTPNLLGKRAHVSGATVRSAEAGFYVEVPQQEAIAAALGLTTLDLFPMERQRVPS